MSRLQDKKEASKRLGIAIHQRYENLVNASGNDEITVTTVDLAQTMYENCEFIIWVLKKYGGLNPPAPDPKPLRTSKPPAPSELPKMPAVLLDVTELQCTCPVLDHGILGRDKHATNCPLYVPVW